MSETIVKRLSTTPLRRIVGAPSAGVLSDAATRLRTACAVWTVLWTLGLFMNNVVGPLVSPDKPLDDAWPYPANPVAFTVIGASAIAFFYLRSAAGHRPGRTVLNLALLYEVFVAAAIGLVNQWTPNTVGLSWLCVVVLVHPLIVPDTPGRTFLAACAAASMDPAALAVTAARGVEMPETTVMLWTFLPTYICAALSVVPSRLVMRLGREISSARELGSYRLGERLAVGGMGEVYRAEHRYLARPAAIKLIRPELLGGAGPGDRQRIVQRFEREARVISLLRSPHTIALYDYGVTDDGVLYYVMELLDGIDLETMVQRFGPLAAVRAVHFLMQICDSLAEAHEQGIVHRDIKPANVYVCRRGRSADAVRVLDFGLAKPIALEAASTALSHDGSIPGTPAFMAPEQALGQPVDHRSDIYAVGCLAHFLLTGKDVFEGHTALEVLSKHVKASPAPPSASSELEIPSGLDAIVLRCLEKDPDRRPRSADELAGLLAAASDGHPWTTADARRWWEGHDPEAAAVDTALGV